MSKIQNTGYAYENLLPLCAVDENGVVDREHTVRNVLIAVESWPVVSKLIPESERESIKHQIDGAAKSLVG